MLTLIQADYHNAQHAEAIIELMDYYARDPMGGGAPLAEIARQQLVNELAKRPFALSILCYFKDQAVGLINGFEGFSTFRCQPLINIHDVIVHPDYRRQGICEALFLEVERIARVRNCCKVTLEVLQGNIPAQRAYEGLGFAAYQLDPTQGNALFWQKNLRNI